MKHPHCLAPLIFLPLLVSCQPSNQETSAKLLSKQQDMNTKVIPYNDQLKQLQLADIPYNKIALDGLSEPFSKSEESVWYDHRAFSKILRETLTRQLGSNVTKLLLFTPKEAQPYVAFAYLSKQEIVAMEIADTGNFKLWMDNILKKHEEAFSGSFFNREPDPNERYLLAIDKGGLSIKSGIGVLFDDKPHETGAYLYKMAPSDYNQFALHSEKEQFMRNYVKTNGETINTGNLQRLFHELMEAKNLTPNTPENNEMLYREFESLANYAFPEVLKTLLNMHNGVNNTGFLPAHKILTEWKIWKKIYDDPDWKLEDLTGHSHADGYKTVGVYTNPYWIPFYSTEGGNFLAIDYAPGTQGRSGQIIAFGADEDRIRLVADNMEAFLQQLISGNRLVQKVE